MSLSLSHSMQKLLLLLGVVFLVLVFAESAHSAAYMKLGDIKGEATHKDHKGWIEINSVSTPLMQASDVAKPAATARSGVSVATGDVTGDGVAAVKTIPKRNYEPIKFSKPIDKSTPLLRKAAQDGTVFATAIVDVDDPDNPGQMLRYELKNVFITSYQTAGAASSSAPQEGLSLNYEEVKLVKPRAVKASQ